MDKFGWNAIFYTTRFSRVMSFFPMAHRLHHCRVSQLARMSKIVILLLRPSLVAILITLASGAQAAGYPDKPVRLIVPFAPGGGVDFIARTISLQLSEALGKPVIVDNRAGGGATIGTEIGARAAPDGYTLLVGTSTSLSVNPVLMKVQYDSTREFTAIALLGSQPHVFVINPAVPAKSLREFITLAKAKPGFFRYSSSGNGGPAHLAGELFKQATNTELVHLPYRGQSASIISVASGEAQFSVPSIASVLPQIRAAKLRGIAVTSQKRVPVAEDIPTLSEEGYAGIESSSWTGLFGPVGMPPAIVQNLIQNIALVLKSPDIVARFSVAGVTPGGENTGDFAMFVQKDIAKWGKVVRLANIHTD